MLLACTCATRSPDPNTQVGACLVDKKNRILGTGYNAWPRGICSSGLPWDRNGDPFDVKYAYVVHAEKNAIFNALGPVDGATLYVTMYPCNECAKDIIQAGVSKIIYLDNPYESLWQTRAAKRMFEMLDIPVRKHEWYQDPQTILEKIGARFSVPSSSSGKA